MPVEVWYVLVLYWCAVIGSAIWLNRVDSELGEKLSKRQN